MIHIVFNQDDISVLQAAIEMDETLQGEVTQIKDDFAVGPIENLYSEEGIAERKQWWNTVLEGGDYQHLIQDASIDDNQTVAQLKEKLEENVEEVLWIWAAQNAHDVCGYYWLISQFKDYAGRVMILYLNNLPFINEKGNIFYPTTLSSILPKEFLKAKKLARPITPSEFEVDPDEWLKLTTTAGIRQLEGGKKLIHQGYHFFDGEILKFITGDWQKANKVIHQFLGKSKYTTVDAYLLWRLKELIAAEKIEVQGKVGQMKEFEVKLKGSNENVIPA